jgi:hypothetical protein
MARRREAEAPRGVVCASATASSHLPFGTLPTEAFSRSASGVRTRELRRHWLTNVGVPGSQSALVASLTLS